MIFDILESPKQPIIISRLTIVVYSRVAAPKANKKTKMDARIDRYLLYGFIGIKFNTDTYTIWGI